MDDNNNKDQIVEIVDKQKSERAVSECNNLRTFIKTVIGRNIIFLSEQEYDRVHAEYRKIIGASEISNSDDAIADVWNGYNPEQVPDTKCGKYQNIFLTDNDINLSILNNISENFKENFQNYKCKNNVSLIVYHGKFTG